MFQYPSVSMEPPATFVSSAAQPDWLPGTWWGHVTQVLSPQLLLALSLFSGALFLVSLFGASWAVRRLPADYLLHDRERRTVRGRARTRFILRNAIGLILLVMGVIMLALPGQGLLTILAAFTIMDFPGKRRLEHRLMLIPSVFKTINRLRRRSGRPPLLVPDDATFGASPRT